MTEFVFGPYRLLVDVETTRAYYSAHPLPWVTCGCAGCRNFAQAVKLLPAEAKGFFAALGLDPEKPGEVTHLEEAGDAAAHHADCWYHLCGSIRAGGPWKVGLPPEAWVDIGKGFSVAFSRKCALLPEDFPRPCFQMDIDCRLPWLLGEPNPYALQ